MSIKSINRKREGCDKVQKPDGECNVHSPGGPTQSAVFVSHCVGGAIALEVALQDCIEGDWGVECRCGGGKNPMVCAWWWAPAAEALMTTLPVSHPESLVVSPPHLACACTGHACQDIFSIQFVFTGT